MKKKALALILSLIMIVQMAPVGTFASAADGTEMELVCTQESHTHDDSCKETVLTCTMEETTEGENPHTHEAGCFSLKLLCGKEETEGHTHSDACKESTLTCELPEDETHTHEEGCYTQSMVCGLEEIEAHTHKKDCFSYVCGKTEHQHSDGCYAAVIPADEEVEGESSEPTETTAPTETTEDETVPETTEGENVPETSEGETVPDETQPEETKPTLYDQLLAAESLQAMADLFNGNTDEALSLTAEELDELETYANNLNETTPDEDAYANVMESITAIRDYNGYSSCTCGTETDKHDPECPLFETEEDVAPYASGYQTGDGYVIYYANETNAALFTNPNCTTVSYNSSRDVIRFDAVQSNDPSVYFSIESAGLAASDYPYVVITYRGSKAGQSQQFIVTSNLTGATANQNTNANVSASTDGTFQTTVLNMSTLSCWTGTIYGFRYDYYGTTEGGDWFEVDSIAFCKTLDDANYVKWERQSLLNNHGVFSATDAESAKAMARLFSDAHNVVVSWSDGAVVLTAKAAHTDKTGAHYTGVYDCYAFGTEAAFDPYIRFYIPGSIDNSYRYMVVTYMTPDDPAGIYYDISSKYPDKVQTYESFGNKLNIQIFPQAVGGSLATEKYSRFFEIYEKDVYYSNYILLEDDLLPSTVDSVRIDPFMVQYATSGSKLYISSIIFCQSLDEADKKIDEELEEKYPYDYQLVYDGNVTDGSVSNLPVQELSMRTAEATRTFRVSSTVPVRANYTFVGWSTATNSSGLLTDGQITLTGTKNEVTKQTLYAIWEENKATLNYKIVGESGGATISSATETLSVVTGTAQGTTGTANTGFKIVGWYTDEGCTIAADTSFATNTGNGTYTTKSMFKPTKDSSAFWTDTTYYVKIAYAVADLTITTSNLDTEYSYIFTVSGEPSDSSISFNPMTIVIDGNGSVTIKSLPVGNYTVTEQNEWIWRYKVENDTAKQINVDGSTAHTVTFGSYTTSIGKWLDGNAYYKKED